MSVNEIAAAELIRQANAYHREEKYKQAIAAYREAIALMPDSPVYVAYNFMIGGMLAEMQHYDEAVQAYRETVRAIPEHDEAWLGLGECLMLLERDKEASEAFDCCIEILVLQRRDEEAFGAFERCIEIDHRLSQVMYYGATVYARLGNSNRASEYLGKAVKLRPEWERRARQDLLLRKYL